MREVAVVSAVRTPFGKFGGLLKDFSAIDLGTKAVKAVIKKINFEPTIVDEVYMGVAVLAGTASVAARQVLISSGLPAHTPSL
ncbi:acetyl-CoA C-acyltransferase, partial [Candidatus Bathyarchaeota archaeon]|nr:acetyl-CoA C-acyltransferase [Candidatus Bathyarchaeota archaeon]